MNFRNIKQCFTPASHLDIAKQQQLNQARLDLVGLQYHHEDLMAAVQNCVVDAEILERRIARLEALTTL